MSLRRILNEYIKRYEGNGFKGYEYFKHVINVSGAKWIEEKIADGIENPRDLLQHENKFIHSNGSQYIQFHYKGDDKNRFILRLSTHDEDRDMSNNSHYSIDAWNSSPREIKDHVNTFIDLAVVYFNAINKKGGDKDLTENENRVYLHVKNGKSFHEPTTYPSLDVVHRKAVKKRLNNSSPNMIRLP